MKLRWHGVWGENGGDDRNWNWNGKRGSRRLMWVARHGFNSPWFSTRPDPVSQTQISWAHALLKVRENLVAPKWIDAKSAYCTLDPRKTGSITTKSRHFFGFPGQTSVCVLDCTSNHCIASPPHFAAWFACKETRRNSGTCERIHLPRLPWNGMQPGDNFFYKVDLN